MIPIVAQIDQRSRKLDEIYSFCSFLFIKQLLLTNSCCGKHGTRELMHNFILWPAHQFVLLFYHKIHNQEEISPEHCIETFRSFFFRFANSLAASGFKFFFPYCVSKIALGVPFSVFYFIVLSENNNTCRSCLFRSANIFSQRILTTLLLSALALLKMQWLYK